MHLPDALSDDFMPCTPTKEVTMYQVSSNKFSSNLVTMYQVSSNKFSSNLSKDYIFISHINSDSLLQEVKSYL